jgi:Holliday junction resolvase RusA-like endonuclease
MARIKIKPMSVNGAWRGGPRYRTNEYKAYEEELLYMLPKGLKLPSGKLFLRLTVGVSSKASDLDNCVKPFLDILQKKYKFNDKLVYGMDLWKDDVKKGEEYIEFDISALD